MKDKLSCGHNNCTKKFSCERETYYLYCSKCGETKDIPTAKWMIPKSIVDEFPGIFSFCDEHKQDL